MITSSSRIKEEEINDIRADQLINERPHLKSLLEKLELLPEQTDSLADKEKRRLIAQHSLAHLS